MADTISNQVTPVQELHTRRKDLALIVGVGLNVLALLYLTAAAHARYAGAAHSANAATSVWLPLELFVIAISPALAGYIFLWSERHLESRATQKLLRNFGVFGVGLILAAWVGAVIK